VLAAPGQPADVAGGRQRPGQQVVNDWMLRRAEAEKRRLKQNDGALRHECMGATGATWDQVTMAFQALPPKYRYPRGKSR
jgi:hypothetical protein